MVIGFGLIFHYEHLGFLLAFPLLVGAQRIRDDHDRDTVARCKENPLWKGFALIYYFGLLTVCVAGVLRHRDVTNQPLGVLLILFFFPFIIAMLLADHGVCSYRRA
jgi:quinol-cytochrome oxidoreductase complex cytochrome b subunit